MMRMMSQNHLNNSIFLESKDNILMTPQLIICIMFELAATVLCLKRRRRITI